MKCWLSERNGGVASSSYPEKTIEKTPLPLVNKPVKIIKEEVMVMVEDPYKVSIWIPAVFFLIVASLVFILLSKRRQLRRLKATLVEWTKGELKPHIDPQSTGELGQVILALNEVATCLQDPLKEIHQVSEQLDQVIDEIKREYEGAFETSELFFCKNSTLGGSL